jgi:hypothetical protein
MRAREVIESGDFEAFATLLAQDVVWVGVAPGQLCRNRNQVLDTFRRALEAGLTSKPEILAESDEFMVIDPHVEPALELNPGLHQVLVIGEDDRVIEMRDFPDRRTALEAVGLG